MSKLEEKVLNGLNLIGYSGDLSQRQLLQKAVEIGPKSIEYSKLVNYLANEIRVLGNFDEHVNVISSSEDSVAFIMEVTSLLKELNCPYSCLTDGHVSERLQNTSERLLLLDFLITELMGLRITQEKKPEKKIELKVEETPEAADMKKILITLRFSRPPPDITLAQLFTKIGPTIDLIKQKCGNVDLIGNPIFNGFLSDKQWDTLNGVQKDLHNEYKIRREMLLTRLDVTVQSFQWSDKTKGKDDLIEKIYTEKRKLLKVEPDVTIADLLAARTDLAIIEKTSNSSVRKNTQTSLNKVIIGEVPDRGGRTSEQAPPPPEMPSWQQRVAPPSGGRGGGGFKRGGNRNDHRGGGNWNEPRGGGNWNEHRGGGNWNEHRGGGNNSRDNYQSYDSAGSYNVNNQQNSYESGYSQSNYSSNYSDNYDNSGNYSGKNDQRRNSYSNKDYEQTNKRARTYDSFQQTNKVTYTDQYVQESQHNQQYSRGGGGGGRRGRGGRSNYHRGGNNYR